MNDVRSFCEGNSLSRRLLEIISKDRLDEIAPFLKQTEEEGLNFETTGAQASFQLRLAYNFGLFEPPFFIIKRTVIDEEGTLITPACSATIQIVVGEKKDIFVAEGNGPINALEICLKKGLISFFPKMPVITKIKLHDYTVTDIGKKDGSADKILVEIIFSDGEKQWKTIGCGNNSISAAWRAILDAYVYPFFLKALAA